MKHARKLTSLLLALVMVFALAVTVAAEGTTGTTGTGSITVDNPIKGQTYTAYKIFDVVYEEPTTANHYSYTIGGNSAWYLTVKNYATPENGLALSKVTGTNTYVVTTTDAFSAPAFAAALSAALKTAAPAIPGIPLTTSGTSASVSNLTLGYYFVTSSTGALCNLTTTNPAVTIHDKNEMPFEKTGVTKRDVEVGQVLKYTIKGKVPDTTGFDEYTYEITDTMSEGLTFNRNSLAVKVGTEDVTSTADKCTITYDKATAPNTFKVTIYVMKCTVGDAIEVTYTATVNEKAVATVSTNEAKLTYSNDPNDKESKATKPADEHKVYSAKITIDKYWKEGDTERKLADVGFKLYKKETPENGPETTKYYVKNPDTNAVTWDTDIEKATEVTTDSNGVANFTGLANGTYYLVETTTPAGFNPLTEVKTITINGSDAGTGLVAIERVENKTGAVLPSTGGMGTTIFYVLGAVLVVGAGVLLVTKKRMSQSEI